MPSLHVAYPLLVLLEGWSLMRYPWRFATVFFFLLMCFAAVYLDHHWVLDELAGIAYCLGVFAVARAVGWLRSPLRQPSAESGAARVLDKSQETEVAQSKAYPIDGGAL
jgi:hypothetical protein